MLLIEMFSSWVALVSQVVLGVIFARKVRRHNNSAEWVNALVGFSISLFGTLLFIMWMTFLSVPLFVSKILVGIIASAIFFFNLKLRTFEDSVVQPGGEKTKKRVFFLALLLPHLVVDSLKPEFSVDGMLYHGPVLANILGNNGLWNWSEPNEYIYYSDLSIFQAAIQAHLTQPILLDDAFQIPFLAIIGFGMLALLERSHLPSTTKFLVVFALLTAPVIWLQPRILYVDLAYAASLLTSVVLLVAIFRSRKTDAWTLAALIIAIASTMATKPVGLLTSALLTLTSVLIVFWTTRQLSNFWPRFSRVVLIAAIPISLGSAFYLRNLIQFGNPIYPVMFTIGAVEYPGKIDPSVFSGGLNFSELIKRMWDFALNLMNGLFLGPSKHDYDPRSGGFGMSAWVIIGFAMIAATVVVFKKERLHRLPNSDAALLALMGLLILCLQPMTSDSRYVIGPFLMLAAASIIILPKPKKGTLKAITGGLALVIAANLVLVESKFLMGAGSIVFLSSVDQAYQPSTPGNPRGVGTGMEWLDQNGPKSIFIQSETGVGVGGLAERTQLTQQSYQLYGHCLCNSVSYSDGNPIHEDRLKPLAAELIGGADYVLLYPSTYKELDMELSGLSLVAEIAPIEGVYDEGYSVLERAP